MKTKKIHLFFSIIIAVIVFSSCKKEYETVEQYDENRIATYLRDNSITNMIKDPSGFYYAIINQGNDGVIADADSVLFALKVTSLAGKTHFETPALSNSGEYLGYLTSAYGKDFLPGIQYPKDVIKTAISKVQRGGSVKVIVPSHLAYGIKGNAMFSENEILIIEISVFKEESQAELDEFRISNFLAVNNITAIRDPSGIYYQVLQEGTTGIAADLQFLLKTKYKARLLDGYVFDQTVGDTPYEIELKSTRYFGLKKILVGRKAGTKLRVFLPSSVALGSYGSADVPKNSNVDIEVEIQEVVDDFAPAPTPSE